MRRYLFLITPLLTFLFNGHSAQSQVKLSIKSGIGITNGRSDYSRPIPPYRGWTAGFHYLSITRPYAGISAQFKLSEHLFLEPEISYTGMGFEAHNYYWKVSYYKSNYITLPVSLRYQANKVLGVFVGPYVSYLLSTKSAFDLEAFQSWDAGFQVGTEVTFFKNWGVGARYYNGLLNIDNGMFYYSQEFPDYKLFNRCLQLYLLYSFNLRKVTLENH